MTIKRRDCLKGIAALSAGSMMAGSPLSSGSAFAQSRAETFRHVLGSSFTSLDPTTTGATRDGAPLSTNIYDRLTAFDKTKTKDGFVWDFENIRGELAERIDRSSDGLTYTLHVREGTTWHDGSPVRVEDVKWSLDRAVSAASLSKPQMANGSMTAPEQFTVVGDRQVQIKLAKPDRLTLACLCAASIPMFNSELVKKNAAADDPWGINWLKENTAAGGAFMVEANRPGQQITLKRNDSWKNGKDGQLPFFRRVIAQTIPDVSSRASLVERGDADLTLDAATSDIIGIETRGKARVISTPQLSAFQSIAFNTREAPFNDPRVRKAVASALPYDALFKAALFGRGRPLYDATWTEPPEAKILQPMPNSFDPARAKALLAEAGLGSGFKTTFSFAASNAPLVEPIAALIQESLAKVGIEVSIQKLPEAQFVASIVERKLPMFFDYATSYFPASEYLFRTFFYGDSRWNASGWSNPDASKIADEARFTSDPAKYDELARSLAKYVAQETPVAMLWNPSLDAVTGRDIQGYTYWYHRGADYRDMKRG